MADNRPLVSYASLLGLTINNLTGFPRWQRPRHHPTRHFPCTRTLQGRGQFVEAGAGRHHVVDQRDVLSLNLARTRKCAAHVAPSRVVLQPHLRRGVANALAAGGVERQAELLGDSAGDFGGVVEAAFADAGGVQRHRDQQVGARLGGDGFGQTATQYGHDGELAVIFQARDQAVEREAIRQRGVSAVESRRVLEAGAAGFAAGGGEGALRALGLAVPGQVGMAGAAHGLHAGGDTTQQAMPFGHVI